MTEEPKVPEVTGDEQEVALPNQWQFIDRIPTREDVVDLLETLPAVWGVHTTHFAEYMQALPQRTKVKKPHPTNPNVLVEEYVDIYSLYMSVAGRQQMMLTAQQQNMWRVDVRPEPVTPTGVPGYLSFTNRLVYRVYVDVYVPIGPLEGNPQEKWSLLGSRSGTAWVPESGGSQAAGTNPYEKVETSALGRALGSWGFGVLPGSGIATVEEMAAIRGNKIAMDLEAGTGPGMSRDPRARPTNVRRESRTDLLQSALGIVEEYRVEMGKSEEEMVRQVAKYLVERLGIAEAFDEEQVAIRWDMVKDGQLVMLRQAMNDGLRRLKDSQFGA